MSPKLLTHTKVGLSLQRIVNMPAAFRAGNRKRFTQEGVCDGAFFS